MGSYLCLPLSHHAQIFFNSPFLSSGEAFPPPLQQHDVSQLILRAQEPRCLLALFQVVPFSRQHVRDRLLLQHPSLFGRFPNPPRLLRNHRYRDRCNRFRPQSRIEAVSICAPFDVCGWFPLCRHWSPGLRIATPFMCNFCT